MGGGGVDGRAGTIQGGGRHTEVQPPYWGAASIREHSRHTAYNHNRSCAGGQS